MKRKLALMAISVLPALLLALSALAPSAAAAPVALASPSPRPSLTPPPDPGACLSKVFDNLAHLVIFRCANGGLAFYRISNGQGDFHSWLSYNGWALALPGKVALDNTDDDKYRIQFGRASQADVEAFDLTARTPPNQNGAWYHVILTGPTGVAITDDYFFMSI